MPTLTPELRRVILEEGHARLEDAETHETYVVLKAEDFDRLHALIESNVRDAYPLAMKVFGAAGWDDPIMDEYGCAPVKGHGGG